MAKGFLEVFKFGLYVAIPVTMMLVVANPDILERLIRHRPYVVYPPEGPRPPPPEEIREMVRKRKQSKEV